MAENPIVDSDMENSDDSSDLEKIPNNIHKGVGSNAIKTGFKKTRNAVDITSKGGPVESSVEPTATISEFDPTKNLNRCVYQEPYTTTEEDGTGSLMASKIDKTSEPSLKKVEGYLVRKLTTVSMNNPGQFQ